MSEQDIKLTPAEETTFTEMVGQPEMQELHTESRMRHFLDQADELLPRPYDADNPQNARLCIDGNWRHTLTIAKREHDFGLLEEDHGLQKRFVVYRSGNNRVLELNPTDLPGRYQASYVDENDTARYFSELIERGSPDIAGSRVRRTMGRLLTKHRQDS